MLLILVSGMFVVMAVNAQKFPIASIGWVIVVVVVLVMNGEFPQSFSCELAAASSAYPWKQL